MARYFGFISVLMIAISCTEAGSGTIQSEDETNAVVLNVDVTGEELGYNFAVSISSPDLGCEQYADWWEIVDESGALIHRRVFSHSHIDEQPFERSSGGISVKANQTIIIRAHMNNNGYGTQALKGSVKNGFEEVELTKNFANQLAEEGTQPPDCTN